MKNKKINALMMIDTLGVGGAEVSVKTLSSAMADMGHNVVVLAIRNDVVLDLDPRVNLEILGYKKYQFLPTAYINAIRLRKFIRYLEHKYGCFHLKVANLTLTHKLSHLAGLKDVYYCLHEDIVASNLAKRTGLKKYARKLRICKLFNNKDVVTVSDGVKDSLKAIEGLHCRSVRTIYNPIDVDNVKRLSKERNPYGESQYIVHVGRLSSEKRHDILLEAFRKMRLDCTLVLVGDGPERDSIIGKIHQLKLDGRVVIAGFINNPYPIIRDAKLLVLSSDYEGFGVVLAEALCLDTAVVSTDCKSGPGEIMALSLSDYLVQTGDADAMAIKMKKAIVDVENDQYPFESAAMERFLPANVARQYIDLAD